MVDSVMEWFKTTQYINKKAIQIENLVGGKWLTMYPWPTKTKYDQESEMIFIISKLSYSGGIWY